MLSDCQIRAERPDQPEVLALLAALDHYLASLYPPEANHILSVEALQAAEVGFFVARRQGRAVGTVACRCSPGEPATEGQSYGEIKRMVVDPEHRGLGIGQGLLAAAEAHARQAGCRQALLETGRDQAEAVRLYRAAGYTERGPFGGYPDNGLSLFMAKPL